MSEEESDEPQYKEETHKSNQERKKEIQDPYFKEFYGDIKTDKRDKQTPHGYRETLLMLEEWMEENDINSWQDLTRYHMTELKNYLEEDKGLYGSSADRHLDRLRLFFKSEEAIKEAGVYKEDCIDKINGFSNTNQQLYQKVTGEDVIFVTKDEYREMLDACNSTREELIIRTLWETGMRRSELAETTLQKVKIDEKKIEVDNKKNDGTRTIPFSPDLLPILREWMEYGGREQYSKAEDSPYLIITQHSEQVQPAYINKIVRRVADRAGISESYATDAMDRKLWKPTAHHFRNAYATYRVAESEGAGAMNLKKLAELMGHSNTEQTARYVGLLEDDLEEANEKYRPKMKDKARELAREL